MSLWRSFYEINRDTFRLPRIAAAWEAMKLAWKVRR